MKGEVFRGGIHAVTGSIAAALALYNLMRFGETKERDNAVNVAIYGALWLHEQRMTHRHWSKRDAA